MKTADPNAQETGMQGIGSYSLDAAAPASRDERLTKDERSYRLVEYASFFFVLPACLALADAHPPVLLLLAAGTMICLPWLLLDPTFDRRCLWNAGAVRAGAMRIIRLWLVGVLVLGALVRWATPERFLAMPREYPTLWVLVCVAYPLLSVYPQNLIYRAFITHRYRGVFGSEAGLVWASALAFSFAHIIFQNMPALLLTLAGGLLFANTYLRYHSLLLVSIEHALYGLLVYTIGLGHTLFLPALRAV
jgi:hypothetical protein